MWILKLSSIPCGISLKRYFLILLLLFLSLTSLNAMTQEDIMSNLTISSQLLVRLNNQLTMLEQDLDSKNQSLLTFQMDNQNLNRQLTELESQLIQQTEALNNLSETNKTLMDQWGQLEEQSSNLQTQLTSLSKELKKAESSKVWGITLGVICGIAIGLIGGWAIATF